MIDFIFQAKRQCKDNKKQYGTEKAAAAALTSVTKKQTSTQTQN